jgi:amino acid permease
MIYVIAGKTVYFLLTGLDKTATYHPSSGLSAEYSTNYVGLALWFAIEWSHLFN